MIDELHDELLALRAEVEWPQTPDLAAAVRIRITAEPASRQARRAWLGGLTARPALATVLVALLAVLAGVAAIPPARAAVLRLLGVEGSVRIVRVDRLPLEGVGHELDLGRRMSLDEARALVAFRVRLPTRAGAPRDVRFSQSIAGGAVTVRYGRDLVLTQFQGTTTTFIKKVVGPGTTMRGVTADGTSGVFLSGAPHVIVVADRFNQAVPARSALVRSDVLLWDRDGVAYRLESTRGRTATLAVADSLR
jgi:hypothetical protein